MRDWRINLDPSTHLHFKKLKEETDGIFSLHEMDEWDNLLQSLVTYTAEVINGKPPEEPPTPPSLQADLETAWTEVLKSIQDQHSHHTTTGAASRVIQQVLGNNLAKPGVVPPENWDKAIVLLEHLHYAWDTFVDSIDTELTLANIDRLTKIPDYDHPLQLIDTFNHLREPERWPAYDTHLEQQRKSSEETWQFIESSTRWSDEATLPTDIHGRSRILVKSAKSHWLHWVEQLPLNIIEAIALRDIDDLDSGEELLHIATAKGMTEETLCLLLQHVYYLWTRIDGSLRHSASKRIWSENDSDKRMEYENHLKQWHETELMKRALNVSEILVTNGHTISQNVTIQALRYLSTARNLEASTADQVVNAFREAACKKLVEFHHNLQQVCKDLLTPNVTVQGLLCAGGLPLQDWSQKTEGKAYSFKAVLTAYMEWLQGDSFHYPHPFSGDDFWMAWVVAGSLSFHPNPHDILVTILDMFSVPSEGWNYDDDRFRRSIQRVAHVFTLGAMASEWLSTHGKDSEARSCLLYLLERIHTWIRVSTDLSYEAVVNTALVNIWSRLPLVLKEDAEMLSVSKITDLDHLDLGWTPIVGPRSAKL